MGKQFVLFDEEGESPPPGARVLRALEKKIVENAKNASRRDSWRKIHTKNKNLKKLI